MKIDINDVVQLSEDLLDDGLSKGAIGVVVACFSKPTEAYEVEFSDSEGKTIAQVALAAHQFVRLDI